ncbi:MAG: F0F1 ATP synthase subunit gamma, partial [Patescibacteria group bacterium]|nr:F0F1 ATP synthase subunit gamma [Patescibacteria group bacterium]
NEDISHPYLRTTQINGRSLVIVLSPDKGLCGGLITNLTREFLHYKNIDKNAEYLVIGKKLEGRIASLGSEIIASFAFGTTLPTFDMVYPIFRLIDEYYLSQKVDSVKILSTRFNSIFTQVPQIKTILPVTLPETEKEMTEYLFEPSVNEILPFILKHSLEMTIYQNLLESYLSEQASRMMTMQNATDNANDIIQELKLEYNKSRQAKITNEILDIGSGANLIAA